MGALREILEKNLKVITTVCALLLALSAVLACVNSLLKYVSGVNSMPWADELSIYVVVVMIFLFQSKLEYEGDQLSISALSERFAASQIFQRILYFIRLVVTVGLYAVLIWSGSGLIRQNYTYGTTTSVMHLPMWIMIGVITLGMVLTIFYLLATLLSRGKRVK